jgi:hypothetical protein
MKMTYLLAAALFAEASVAADTACLRADNIDQIRMTGAATALATDKQKRRFDITFVGACGARHPNVFFVVRPDFLPTCISAGAALPTNTEGACLAKTVKPHA